MFPWIPSRFLYKITRAGSSISHTDFHTEIRPSEPSDSAKRIYGESGSRTLQLDKVARCERRVWIAKPGSVVAGIKIRHSIEGKPSDCSLERTSRYLNPNGRRQVNTNRKGPLEYQYMRPCRNDLARHLILVANTPDFNNRRWTRQSFAPLSMLRKMAAFFSLLNRRGTFPIGKRGAS